MPYVYILYSQSLDRYYVGSTRDLDRRINEHNAGRSKATKGGIPWEIKFFSSLPTLMHARKIEYRLKKYKSRTILEQIIHDQKIMHKRW